MSSVVNSGGLKCVCVCVRRGHHGLKMNLPILSFQFQEALLTSLAGLCAVAQASQQWCKTEASYYRISTVEEESCFHFV